MLKKKKRKLTQEQLTEQLNISKNAVSKWERRLNLPYVSIMQDLCKILDITLNELFIREKIDFYKKKWKKEHISKMVLCFISWIILIVSLKFQNVENNAYKKIEK